MSDTAPSHELSPSARHSLRGLLTGGRTSWRQGLDGTAAFLTALVAGAAAGFAVRSLRRH